MNKTCFLLKICLKVHPIFYGVTPYHEQNMLSLEDMALRQEAKKKNENKGISFQRNDGAASAGEYNS